MYKARHLAGHIIRLLIRGEKVEGGILRGSFGGAMGEEGSVEDTGMKFLESLSGRTKGWQRLRRPGSRRRTGEYGICSFEVLTHSTVYCLVFTVTSLKFL